MAEAFKQLSIDMTKSDKEDLISILQHSDPTNFTPEFIEMVNYISEKYDEAHKNNIVRIIYKIGAQNHSVLKDFFRTYPTFYEYVPYENFHNSIGIMTGNISKDELHEKLVNLHRQFYQGILPGIAFEVHAYSRQKITTEHGKKKTFNEAVLNKINQLIVGNELTVDEAVDLLCDEYSVMLKNPLKSDIITQDVLDWILAELAYTDDSEDESDNDEGDLLSLSSVISYLVMKDPSYSQFRSWLFTFIEESKKAFDNGDSESCTDGVKERVITSLRSVLYDDSDLLPYFNQAEISTIINIKANTLSNYVFWAKRLFEMNIRTETPYSDAKDAYKRELKIYFEDGVKLNKDIKKKIGEIINITMESFDDTLESGVPLEDGTWSKIKIELQKLEEQETLKEDTKRPRKRNRE